MAAAWKPIEISRKPADGSNGVEGCQVLRDAKQGPIAERFGRIVSCWSNAEWKLVEIYSYLMDLENWAAADLFEEVRTAKARFSIINKTLEKKLGEQFAKEAWTNVLEPVREFYDDRNDIAHGRFAWSSEYPNDIIILKGWGGQQQRWVYTRAILDALLTELYTRTQKLEWLFIEVAHRTPLRYETGRLISAFHPEIAAQARRHTEGTSDPSELGQPSPGQSDSQEPELLSDPGK